jgi:hypothetical protein
MTETEFSLRNVELVIKLGRWIMFKKSETSSSHGGEYEDDNVGYIIRLLSSVSNKFTF